MAGDVALTGAELAAKLTAPDGPLDLISPANIDRIETNLQIAHAPKSPARDFRTDYLLKVFRYNAQTALFEDVGKTPTAEQLAFRNAWLASKAK